MDKILIIDDNISVCKALTILLEIHRFSVTSCHSPQHGMEILAQEKISLVILDMNFSQDTTSGEEGKEAFYKIRAMQADLPIILLTAWTDLEMAVELVKSGAADYLSKPWDDQKLLVTIKNLIELNETNQVAQKLRRQHQERVRINDTADLRGLIYESTSMQRLVDMAVQVAESNASVLITGPNGAGKEKIAEIIQANSLRNNGPFIKVNIGALPQDLMESELFGAEAGAYTGADKQRIGRFEAADGGTLFLDEIGNLSLSGQMKLLRVLQTGEFERLGSHATHKVDVRVVSATNADLLADIGKGLFREDLFYRLNVIQLALPALAERLDDVIPLIEHFTQQSKPLSKLAERHLLNYTWPGNVRELENACQRAMLFSKSQEWQLEDFGLSPQQAQLIEKVETEDLSEQDIMTALNEASGVISKAARKLGISRQALYRRMDKFGINK
ncbi:sigma-54-dependent transcriptional regulator [Thalassotalea atypica]|uniref:sigma-54-dependent transcriptional regulator n=1 Tax=Thalassotalea atypica TaxID=2054316 RepID=UPI002573C0EB|nr:sigma-54 dependent transcriptional regulator [Thalassotalea atypica]